MNKKERSKSGKWREKYGALVTAIVCLYCLVINWGNSWILVGLLGLGVVICGTIAFSDVKRTHYK